MVRLKPKKKKNFPQDSQKEPAKLDFKERIAQKRRAKDARNKLISSVSFCIFVAIVLGVPLAVTIGIKAGIFIGLGIPLLVLSYNYPRQALWLFLIYMPFGGTFTYAIGEGNALFNLAKDVFYIPALFSLIQDCWRKRLPILIPPKIRPTLFILLGFCLMTLFTVNGIKQFLPECFPGLKDTIQDPQTGELISAYCRDGQPFLQGLFGLKVLLGYFPLVFCAYYLIKDKKTLFFLGRLLVVLAIICCVLALIQFWMLKTGRCEGTREQAGGNLYKANLEARCLVGGALLYSPEYGQIRLPGTFVSPWHWAWFLVANTAIGYMVGFSEIVNAFGEKVNMTSVFWGITGLTSMILALINAIISGQRLAFLLSPAIIIVLLVLSFFLLLTSSGENAKQLLVRFKRLLPIILGTIVSIIIGGFVGFSFFNPEFIQERYNSFVGRWESGNPFDFTNNQLDFVFRNMKSTFGMGLGVATSSARFLGDISFVETFHPKLMFELGYLGFAAFMGFITHLTILTFKAYRSVRDSGIASYGAGFWIFMVIIGFFPYWYPLDTDPVCVYYWFFAGVVLKLPEIDKQEQLKSAAMVEPILPKIKKRSKSSFA